MNSFIFSPRVARVVPTAAIALALIAAFGGAPRAQPETVFEQHFAPRENLEAIDVALISSATRTLDVAAYVLTDVAVIDALAEAARRGVKVRVYRDGALREAGPTVDAAIERLLKTSAEIRYKASAEPPMHLKAFCADGEKLQDNDATILRGAGVCAAFTAHFETMWRR